MFQYIYKISISEVNVNKVTRYSEQVDKVPVENKVYFNENPKCVHLECLPSPKVKCVFSVVPINSATVC